MARPYPKVRLGRDVYNVKLVKHTRLHGKECLGTIWHSRRLIALRSVDRGDDQASTLLHEIVHAISDRHRAGITEAQTLKLEQGLADLVADNMPLLERLSRQLKGR